jgi:hypothetical protein
MHFNVREAIWLPRWNRLASGTELSDDVKSALVAFLGVLDVVRDWFGVAINVHCCLRTFPYNELVGGAKASMHLLGRACDFDVAGVECSIAISRILDAGMLEKWSLRMEDNAENGNKPGWIHLDNKTVPEGGNRFFIP